MNYIEIEKENIILEGITHEQYGEQWFIIYIDENDKRNRIHVNTDYWETEEGIYKCHASYDRSLCNTIEEYREMTIWEIERQAYGSWMDGAR